MATLNIGSSSFRFNAVDVMPRKLVFKLNGTILITVNSSHDLFDSIKKEIESINQ